MNHFTRLAGILVVLSVFAASSAGLSLKTPEEFNVTEKAEEESLSENVTKKIGYESEEPVEDTQNLEKKIKQRAERMKEEKKDNSITGASTKSESGKGLFDSIFGIFS